MEKTQVNIPPNQKINLHYKNHTNFAKPPNNRKTKRPQPHDHPPPPLPDINPKEWNKIIAELAKTANKQARKITTKYTQECVKKTNAKYRQLYKNNPKNVNNKVLKNQYCIGDRNNNILTNTTINQQQTYSSNMLLPAITPK